MIFAKFVENYLRSEWRNWVGFFSACTDSKQFHQLDEWIRIVIGRYFWRQYGVHLKRADFRKGGVKKP